MSRPSEPLVVWEATQPLPRRQVALEAAQAAVYHYARLAVMVTTGQDRLK